jgi:LysM repeat protein
MEKRPSLFTVLLSGLLAIIFFLVGGILVLRFLRLGPPNGAVEPAAMAPAATASLAPAATVPLPATETALPPTEPAANAASPTPLPDTPAPTATPLPSPTPLFYVVQEGDVLFNIALEFGVSVAELQAVNNLTDAATILPGQSLLIPQEGNTPPTATAPPVAAESTPAGPTATPGWPERVLVGRSYLGFEIPAYVFANGPAAVVFIGGIHGGYEWNTVTLAEEAVQYFTDNPEMVPAGVTLHIIPNANPDGINEIFGKITGIQRADLGGRESVEETIAGRFNGNGVDLNRNWECNWSADATWRNEPVNPGGSFFSEPETVALLGYVRDTVQAEAVIFWHSALGIVAPGQCTELHDPSVALARLYAAETVYSTEPFTAYEVTGDASDYFVSLDIPSFAVELTDHFNTQWEMNRDGMLAVLQFFAAEEGE